MKTDEFNWTNRNNCYLLHTHKVNILKLNILLKRKWGRINQSKLQSSDGKNCPLIKVNAVGSTSHRNQFPVVHSTDPEDEGEYYNLRSGKGTKSNHLCLKKFLESFWEVCINQKRYSAATGMGWRRICILGVTALYPGNVLLRAPKVSCTWDYLIKTINVLYNRKIYFISWPHLPCCQVTTTWWIGPF